MRIAAANYCFRFCNTNHNTMECVNIFRADWFIAKNNYQVKIIVGTIIINTYVMGWSVRISDQTDPRCTIRNSNLKNLFIRYNYFVFYCLKIVNIILILYLFNTLLYRIKYNLYETYLKYFNIFLYWYLLFSTFA